MPQDPSVLIIPTTGAPYLSASPLPSGEPLKQFVPPTLFSTGVERVISGIPLTVEPNHQGNAASLDVGTGPPNEITVTGLYNLVDGVDDVPPRSVLALGGTHADLGAGTVPNDGFYSVTSVIDATSCLATKLLPVPPNIQLPEIANGKVLWAVIRQDRFPTGDPLSYAASLGIPLDVNYPVSGPATFADYDAALPPMVVNDESGLFGKVQRT